MAKDSVLLAFITFASTVGVALFTRGLVARLPILLGTAVGYVAALLLGGTAAAGRDFGLIHVQGVDLSRVASAPWFGLPQFVGPAFDGRAMSLLVPVALVLIAENTGHIKAVAAMTKRPLMRYLGRAFAGDRLDLAANLAATIRPIARSARRSGNKFLQAAAKWRKRPSCSPGVTRSALR